jgi:hypothetical protein
MQLLWNADDALAARRYPAAPSWSFASVEGSALSFGFEDDDLGDTTKYTPRHLQYYCYAFSF